jgi:hypothetical protein
MTPPPTPPPPTPPRGNPTARKLREAAVEYATHGWPVAPLAVPGDHGCPCGGGCDAMHLLADHSGGITTPADAERVWADGAWQVAIVTARFDVLDIPSRYGARIHGRLKTRCPTATARPGRRLGWVIEPGPVRWHLYLDVGSGVDPTKVRAGGGVLHSGPDDWIPAPPSRTPETGRVAWVVPPMQARWRPYRRADIFDVLGLT